MSRVGNFFRSIAEAVYQKGFVGLLGEIPLVNTFKEVGQHAWEKFRQRQKDEDGKIAAWHGK